jgi:hypothetical protein
MSDPIATTRAGSRRAAWRRAAICLLLIGMTVLPTGCVRRRLNVRTNPPGALVYVDNQLIGETPCGVDITYYGTREIRLVKPGFEPLAVNQPIPTPWYQYPPLDFVSDNFWPTKIRDNRTVVYELRPQLMIPNHQIIQQGEQLRLEAQSGAVQPAGAIMPLPGAIAP